jgi:hypothetical protein
MPEVSCTASSHCHPYFHTAEQKQFLSYLPKNVRIVWAIVWYYMCHYQIEKWTGLVRQGSAVRYHYWWLPLV